MSRILTALLVVALVLSLLVSCESDTASKKAEASKTLGKEGQTASQHEGKRIEVGGSVLPDIFDATAEFYKREGDDAGISEWTKFATKTEKGRGKGVWASCYVTLENERSFVEIKAIVKHDGYNDCETDPVRYDWSSGGGKRMLSGCATMYQDYKK